MMGEYGWGRLRQVTGEQNVHQAREGKTGVSEMLSCRPQYFSCAGSGVEAMCKGGEFAFQRPQTVPGRNKKFFSSESCDV